jgi:uncharacterized membrane protein
MTPTEEPFVPSRPEIKSDAPPLLNVSFPERVASVAVGTVVLLAAARRRPLLALVLGVSGLAMLRRGATGHCDLYQALDINSQEGRFSGHGHSSGHAASGRGTPDHLATKVVESITVQRPREKIYAFWRNLENLPRFMRHVKYVEVLDAKRSRWTVEAPAGQTVAWTAEIINERPNELIAWESLPGAQVRNAGSVWFESMPEGGTYIKVALDYTPPAGAVGALMARLFGQAPGQRLREDLQRFKALMEKPVSADRGND